MSDKQKYLTKTVKFGGKDLVLYSLDGLTWSTRRQELLTVKERLETQRVTFSQIKAGGAEDGEKEEKEEESEDAGDGPVEINLDDSNEGEDEAKDDSEADSKPQVHGKKSATQVEKVKVEKVSKKSGNQPQKNVPKKKPARPSNPALKTAGSPAKRSSKVSSAAMNAKGKAKASVKVLPKNQKSSVKPKKKAA